MTQVGIREGEKLHEVMITAEDARTTYDYGDHYIIYPHFDWWNTETHFKQGGSKVRDGFRYSSDTNERWLSVEEMRERLKCIEGGS